MSDVQIKLVSYAEERVAIEAIRRSVFQEEQGVAPELEFDGYDPSAQHLLAYLNNQPVGTARIRKVSHQRAKIERLAVLSTARRQGIGRKLMEKALADLTKQDYQEALIHAQEYVKDLYQKLGFESVGSPFEEAGIPHIKMIKTLKLS